MESHLPPLAETLSRSGDGDCLPVVVEAREEPDCWIVGTLEDRWDGPAHPYPVVRVRAVVAKRPDDPLGEEIAVFKAVERAENARRRSIRPCAVCGDPTPPEHGHRMEDGFVCHGCAETTYGVVH